MGKGRRIVSFRKFSAWFAPEFVKTILPHRSIGLVSASHRLNNENTKLLQILQFLARKLWDDSRQLVVAQ